MASCEACGNECPDDDAAFCAACGHRLGEQPEEPITVNVRLVDSPLRGCWAYFTITLPCIDAIDAWMVHS